MHSDYRNDNDKMYMEADKYFWHMQMSKTKIHDPDMPPPEIHYAGYDIYPETISDRAPTIRTSSTQSNDYLSED